MDAVQSYRPVAKIASMGRQSRKVTGDASPLQDGGDHQQGEGEKATVRATQAMRKPRRDHHLFLLANPPPLLRRGELIPPPTNLPVDLHPETRGIVLQDDLRKIKNAAMMILQFMSRHPCQEPKM